MGDHSKHLRKMSNLVYEHVELTTKNFIFKNNV